MKNIILILFSILLFGCSTVPGPISGKGYATSNGKIINMPAYSKELKEYYLKTHPQERPEISTAIRESVLLIGMTKDQVKASWGLPEQELQTILQNMRVEEWDYSGYRNALVFFKDNSLFIVQTIPE